MRFSSVLALVVVLGAAVGVASAHGWSVDADDQVVGDGTVVVRHVSMLEHGYLAVHVVEDGEPGRVLGTHRFGEHGEFENVEVALDGAAWANVSGPSRLVAVVHADDGDDQFEWPGDDGIYRSDDPVADRFAVRKTGDGSARVLAVRQQTDGNVSLGRVELPSEGFVVLYDDEDGERGEVVGVRRLPAGHHEDVIVGVAPRYYNGEQSRLYLVAAVHVDDGDGVWEPDADDLVRVDGSAVTTSFDAEKTRRSMPTPSPTATPESTETPSTTTRTSESTATRQPSPTATATASSSPGTATTPGFGPFVALVALAVALLGVARRRPPLTRR